MLARNYLTVSCKVILLDAKITYWLSADFLTPASPWESAVA